MAIFTEPVSRENCRRCLFKKGNETFYYMHGQYIYDVDQARKLTGDGREPVEVEEESVQASVAECELDEFHLPHVKPSIPGIIAHVHYYTPRGELIKASVLIDGHHRAARCLKDGLPYFAYLLSEEESLAILIKKPDALKNLVGDSKNGTAAATGRSDGPEGNGQQREAKSGSGKAVDPVAGPQEVAPGSPPAEASVPPKEVVPKEDARPPKAPPVEQQIVWDYEAKYQKSRPFAERSRRTVAGNATHDHRSFSPFEVYYDRAEGACKWDVGGNKIIDYWMGHGSLLCGHGFKPVLEALARQAARGTQFGACHETELRWAELVCRLVPSADKVRFTASGTEAAMLALKIARAYTGREVILKFKNHAHGWYDEVLAYYFPTQDAGYNRNAVANVCQAELSDPDDVVKFIAKRRSAAVILEPGGGSRGGEPCHPDFLKAVREATRKYHTLLIYDEVGSAFRASVGGIQQTTGIRPDLTVLGKVLAGGLPGGAVTGRARYMDLFGAGVLRRTRRVFVPHTGTANAHPLSAAAGVAMLEHLAEGAALEQAKAATLRLVDKINQAADASCVDVHAYANGSSIFYMMIGARTKNCALGPSSAVARLFADHPERYDLLRRALLVEGVDCPPNYGWVSTAHDDEIIDATAQAFQRAFGRLRQADGFRLGAAAK